MVENDFGTHWENCATEGGESHYACAVAEIERLRAQLHAQLQAQAPQPGAISVLPSGIVFGDAQPAYEFVRHPAHYNSHPAGIECITVIEPMCLNVGTAIKHLWRAGLKPGADHVQDLRKAITYIEFEIARVERGKVGG